MRKQRIQRHYIRRFRCSRSCDGQHQGRYARHFGSKTTSGNGLSFWYVLPSNRKQTIDSYSDPGHMKDFGDIYRTFISSHLAPQNPRIPFYSSVTTKLLASSEDFESRYWQENLENPVLFRSAVKLLIAEDPSSSVHLEVGPHSALAGPLRQIYKESSSSTRYVSTLSRNRNDSEAFLEAVGHLHSSGVKISFPHSAATVRVLTDLPPYPWHYDQSYWSETRVMRDWRFRRHLPHDLLGVRILEGTDLTPCWRTTCASWTCLG